MVYLLMLPKSGESLTEKCLTVQIVFKCLTDGALPLFRGLSQKGLGSARTCARGHTAFPGELARPSLVSVLPSIVLLNKKGLKSKVADFRVFLRIFLRLG